MIDPVGANVTAPVRMPLPPGPGHGHRGTGVPVGAGAPKGYMRGSPHSAAPPRPEPAMPRAVAGPEIERLIQLLARLPGLGPRSARRVALHLIKKREGLMAPLAAALTDALGKIVVCRTCGNVDVCDPCSICTDPTRDPLTLVVVADVSDLWALERAGVLNARYHVLGGVLSPLDGVGPEDLNLAALVDRVHQGPVAEVILALGATVDGQTTAHYVTDLLRDLPVKVTRLAQGVPVGGELDYLDEGTLSAAIRARTRM